MTVHTRVWEEPVRGGFPGPDFLGLDGLSRINGVMGGDYPSPPISRLIGIKPVEVGVGMATFSTPASPWLTELENLFAGGVVALAADGPASASIGTTLAAGELLATSELNLNFLGAAGPSGGALIGRGRLIHKTRSLGYSEVQVEDASGRLLAHGTTRCVITSIDPSWIPPQEILNPDTDGPDPYQRPIEYQPLSRDLWTETSGLEIIQMGMSVDSPLPIVALMGFRPVKAEAGAVTVSGPASGWLSGPERRAYGGVIAHLAYEALSLAVYSTLPAGMTQAALDLTVHFFRPGPTDGTELQATGTVVRKGRTIAVGRSEVINADGKTVATATGSLMLLEGRGWPRDRVPYDFDIEPEG